MHNMALSWLEPAWTRWAAKEHGQIPAGDLGRAARMNEDQRNTFRQLGAVLLPGLLPLERAAAGRERLLRLELVEGPSLDTLLTAEG
jgi:hypothetical protein